MKADVTQLYLVAYRGAGGRHVYVGTEDDAGQHDLACVDVQYDGEDNQSRIEEAKDLAVLFSAAPQLFRGLTWALDIIDSALPATVHTGHADYDAAREALAKARCL